MKVKITKKVEGKLFTAKDDNGNTRLFFQPKKGKLRVMSIVDGSGYYIDVLFGEVEN